MFSLYKKITFSQSQKNRRQDTATSTIPVSKAIRLVSLSNNSPQPSNVNPKNRLG